MMQGPIKIRSNKHKGEAFRRLYVPCFFLWSTINHQTHSRICHILTQFKVCVTEVRVLTGSREMCVCVCGMWNVVWTTCDMWNVVWTARAELGRSPVPQ